MAADAEVAQFDVAAAVDQDIGRFHVAMNDLELFLRESARSRQESRGGGGRYEFTATKEGLITPALLESNARTEQTPPSFSNRWDVFRLSRNH